MTKLDPGLHHGVLTGQAVTEAGSGNLQIELQFSIYEGVDRTVFLSLTDRAREAFVDDTLRSLNFNDDFENPRFGDNLYTDGIDLWLKYETYEGREREKWGIASGGVGRGTPAPADKLKRLNASWKSKSPPPRPLGRPMVPHEYEHDAKFGNVKTHIGNEQFSRLTPPAEAKSRPTPPAARPTKPEHTKDSAWDIWQLAAGDKAVNVEQWQAAIDEIGDDESKFGPAEWGAVASKAVPW